MPQPPAATSRGGLRWDFDQLVTACLLAAVGARACLAPAQNDTWWQLRAGRELWRTHDIPRTNDWSFTFPSHRWDDHEWLYQALAHLAHRAGGMPFLALLTGAATWATVLATWRLMGGSSRRRAVLVVLTLPVTLATAAVRPQAVSLLLLVVVVALLRSGRVWPVPLIVLVWANLHGAFVFALVAVGAALVAAALASRDRLRPLLLAAIGAALASLATPWGFGIYTFLVSKSDTLDIEEWQPLWRFPVSLGVVIVAAVALAVAVTTQRRVAWGWPRTCSTAVAIALLPFAVRYVRVAPAFVLVVLPVLADAWDRWRPAADRTDDASAANTVLAGVVVAAMLGWVGVSYADRDASLGWDPISEPIVSAVRSCPGPLYNRYDDGGYLEWFAPEVDVFVDSRLDPYPLPFLRAHFAAETSGDQSAAVAEWGLRCAVLPPGSASTAWFRAEGWVTLADDGAWVVLRAP
jgi:hypothetical protein